MKPLTRIAVLLLLSPLFAFSTATPAHAGTIVLNSFNADIDSFTSDWTWTRTVEPGFPNGSWNANTQSVLIVDMDDPPGTTDVWKIRLIGLNAGNFGELGDVSQHLVDAGDPLHGDNVPGPSSGFDYGVATTEIGPELTWFEHPGVDHIDQYTMTTVLTGPGVVNITFSGEHPGEMIGLERLPEPGTLSLFALGALMLARRRR